MQEYQVGDIVCSCAGHDSGSYYIIMKQEKEYVYLVDGVYKKIKKPKKKKKKHILFVTRPDKRMGDQANDLEYKRILKLYKKNQI
ncbi:MAG: RNA-binding protein [Lachnospiraceae bacterium]|jgi:ribosomal protein L14E/L6E/L27E|nr:RNA-binding protein [Lachnospiraceae bacterium]